METLFELLINFDGRIAKSEANLTSMFEKIAKRVLYGGYFLINNSAKIYPTDIEFYYHSEIEEDDEFKKDYGMYHIGDEIPYFPTGSIYPHSSGVDVRFENKNKNFRASFLIREYKFEYPDESGNTDLPTQLWEDMFGYCTCFNKKLTIEWVDDLQLENPPAPTNCARKNLRKYIAKNQPELLDNKKVYDVRPRRFIKK